MDNAFIYIILGIIAIVLIYKYFINSSVNKDKRPPASSRPEEFIENDKLIIIEDVSESELSKAIIDF